MNRLVTMRRLAAGLALLPVALTTVWATPAATAVAPVEPSGDIVSAVPGAGVLSIVFTANDLPPGDSLQPDSVNVRFSGRSLEVSSTAPVTEEPSVLPRRVTVLAIDTSGSMADDGKIQGARDAATAYVQSVPEDVLIGLVGFGTDAYPLVTPPTADRAAVLAQIQGLRASGDTALYDAVVLAVNVAGPDGLRSVLVLSDGENDDPGSPTTIQDAVTAARTADVRVDAVAIGADQTPELEAIATGSGGRVTQSASAAEFAIAFEEAAAAVSNQLAVAAAVPPGLADTEGDLVVRAVSVGGIPVDDSTTITTVLPAEPSPSVSPTSSLVSAPGPSLWDRSANVWFLIGLVALFGGVVVLLTMAFAAVPVGRTNPQQLQRRLSVYSLRGAAPVKESETSTGLSNTQVGRSVVGLAGRVMQTRDVEVMLARRLESAGVPFKPAEWLLLHVGTAVVLALLLLLLFGGRLIPMLVGLVLGIVLPWAYLSVKETRRHRDFQAQMPDALQLMAGSLSAGYSLPQAIDTVVREGQDPISNEFNRALVETRLGVPLEDALEGVAARMSSPDFRWVVMALKIQRDVGGNLAEVLSTVSTTMRERSRLNRQIQVLSAEGRLSAWILGGLPFAFIVYLLLVRPEYLEPLYTTRLGAAMLLLSGVLVVVGVLWLRRVVKVRV